jgi:hypothetical protein
MSYLFREDVPERAYEFVEVPGVSDHPLPPEYRSRIFIHTVHDGEHIPAEFLYDKEGKHRVDLDVLDRAFARERDWGANLVASKIATALGVRGYARCNIARALMDFNRFPGSTPPGHTAPLERLAVSEPFNYALDHSTKTKLLVKYYDEISDAVEKELHSNKLIMIAVHTYDEHNASLTRRPHLSLLSSMMGYQRDSKMPYGVFDPLYPDVLGESTCSRILRDRLALNLERTGFRVAHNHPYPLPEGSMEVRAQVWFFFNYLKQRIELEHPETKDNESYMLVWRMLLNTNLRLAEGEALRSYLHRFRKVSKEELPHYRRARDAYEHVSRFLAATDVVMDFRRSKERPSSIGLEVRKDLIGSFDAQGHPLPLTAEQDEKATLIGNVIAGAITTYFETDTQFL